MKRYLITILVITAALMSGCASLGTVVVPPDLDTYAGLSAAIEGGEDIRLYDVRTPEEFATGHIPTARNIPHDKIATKLPFWEKNRVIVVYCASGGRSHMAYKALTDKGFAYVTDFGGIANWEGNLVTGS